MIDIDVDIDTDTNVNTNYSDGRVLVMRAVLLGVYITQRAQMCSC